MSTSNWDSRQLDLAVLAKFNDFTVFPLPPGGFFVHREGVARGVVDLDFTLDRDTNAMLEFRGVVAEAGFGRPWRDGSVSLLIETADGEKVFSFENRDFQAQEYSGSDAFFLEAGDYRIRTTAEVFGLTDLDTVEGGIVNMITTLVVPNVGGLPLFAIGLASVRRQRR
ncbi:MAG: hypothetical protein AAGD00_06720 [Planctomycetota bacterium]